MQQMQLRLHGLLLLRLQEQQQGRMAWGIQGGSKTAAGYQVIPEMAIRLFQGLQQLSLLQLELQHLM
jgi:hypothetical protein